MSFKEFLNNADTINESVVKHTKDDWLKVFGSMNKADYSSLSKFLDSAHKVLNINVYSPKNYNKAKAAHKKFLEFAGSDSVAKAPTTPKAQPTSKVEPKAPKPAPAPKLNFDTSGIVKKYKQLSALISDIESDTRVLVREYEKLRNGQNMNNLETPDLYELYLSIEGLKYTQPLHKEITHKLRNANDLAGRAAKFAKSRK